MGFKFSSTSSVGKWLGFVTAVWVQAISGNNYTFSNYSDALKTIMKLTQLQLNILSVTKDVGKAFGLLAGFASDRLPTPVILLIGSVEGFIGYGVQWLVVSHKIKPLPYWAMCIFLCLGGNSSTWMNTAILVTCIRNFRKNRGPVSGILKGFVGLSTAIFTDICSALFSNNPSSFLVMLSVVPFAVCLTAIVFLREVPPPSASGDDKEESRYLAVINIIAVIVAFYLLAYDLSGRHSSKVKLAFAIILVILLAMPLLVPFYIAVQNFNRSKSSPTLDVENTAVSASPAQETAAEEGKNSGETTRAAETEGEEDSHSSTIKRKQPVIGEDHTVFQALKTIDFWILFVSFLCGVGTGMTVMNNMGQMALALGYTNAAIFVSLLSIFGFFGRILSGWASEIFIKKRGTPRPLLNAVSQVIMIGGFGLMALAIPGSLYLGSVIIGICYGVRLAVTVPTASELFGLKYYGIMYNVLILNLPLGSFLFSGLLAGFLYDSQATKASGGGNTCLGPHCYRLVYIIMAVVSVIGFGLDIILAIRTKKLYRDICASKKSSNQTGTASNDN